MALIDLFFALFFSAALIGFVASHWYWILLALAVHAAYRSVKTRRQAVHR